MENIVAVASASHRDGLTDNWLADRGINNTISIGSFTVKNVYTIVPLIETANSNLLGISFMKKFRDVKGSIPKIFEKLKFKLIKTQLKIFKFSYKIN